MAAVGMSEISHRIERSCVTPQRLAIALRSGTILIALKGTKPPFDVGDLRVIPYEDRVGGEKEAIHQIQEMLRSL